jgi:CheY-like chemotaxis protein
MKLSAQQTKCLSPSGKLAHAGTTARSATGAHLPLRRPAPSYGPANDSDVSTASSIPVLMDSPRADLGVDTVIWGDNVPRVLHIDRDADTGRALAALLMPEIQVVHVGTLMEARRMLGAGIFSLVVIDTALPDGDGSSLLSALSHTPMVVYSAREPDARHTHVKFMPKPYSTPRQLWSTISAQLGMPSCVAGD